MVPVSRVWSSQIMSIPYDSVVNMSLLHSNTLCRATFWVLYFVLTSKDPDSSIHIKFLLSKLLVH